MLILQNIENTRDLRRIVRMLEKVIELKYEQVLDNVRKGTIRTGQVTPR